MTGAGFRVAQLVPTDVERVPLFHWRPGTRLLAIGDRDGAAFGPAGPDAPTFTRSVDHATIRAVAAKAGCDGYLIAWREPLSDDHRLADLVAGLDGPIAIATAGWSAGPIDAWLDRVDVWSLLIGPEPGPAAVTIATSGRHVEAVWGLDREPDAVPEALRRMRGPVHLRGLHPGTEGGPDYQAWERAAATRLDAARRRIYPLGATRTTCPGCDEVWVWRQRGRIRFDALDPATGRCRACGQASDITFG